MLRLFPIVENLTEWRFNIFTSADNIEIFLAKLVSELCEDIAIIKADVAFSDLIVFFTPKVKMILYVIVNKKMLNLFHIISHFNFAQA